MAPPKSLPFFITLTLFFALGTCAFSLAKGSTSLPFEQLFFAKNHLILQLRLARTASAFISGAELALAGLLMQLLLQNPLADPYILGTSSGAALGMLITMLLGLSANWLMTGAWTGSLIAMLIIAMFAHKHRWQTQRLLLMGIALAMLFSAVISGVLILMPSTTLPSLLYWLSGDLNNVSMPWFGFASLGFGFLLSFAFAPAFNLLARGDKEAAALGLETTHYHKILYLISTFLTANAVTLSGSIGFIGLLIPHLTRRLVGYNHFISIPISLLLGGSLLMLADTIARSLFAPTQLPVGILIAIIGVPTFIGLMA